MRAAALAERPADRSASSPALQLPPTPADLEAVETIQHTIERIRSNTDAIMAVAGENAFGFSASGARQIHERVNETVELCRRCEHSLRQSSARAAVAAGSESRDLITEAAHVMATFEEVARAARSSISQLSQAGQPTGHAYQNGQHQRDGSARTKDEQSSWEQLFALQPTVTPTAMPPAPVTPSRRDANTVEAEASRRVERRRPYSSARSTVSPIKPPKLSPTSTALNLWSARHMAVEPPACGLRYCMDGGAFASLEEEQRVASHDPGAHAEGKGRSRSSSAPSLATDPPSEEEVRRARLQLSKSLHRLRRSSCELRDLLEANVWGFTPEARERLGTLELEGRAVARDCRASLTRALVGSKDATSDIERRDEVERCIREFGAMVEVAHHVADQHEQSRATLRQDDPSCVEKDELPPSSHESECVTMNGGDVLGAHVPLVRSDSATSRVSAAASFAVGGMSEVPRACDSHPVGCSPRGHLRTRSQGGASPFGRLARSGSRVDDSPRRRPGLQMPLGASTPSITNAENSCKRAVVRRPPKKPDSAALEPSEPMRAAPIPMSSSIASQSPSLMKPNPTQHRLPKSNLNPAPPATPNFSSLEKKCPPTRSMNSDANISTVVSGVPADHQLQTQLTIQPLVESALKQNDQIIEENERAIEKIMNEVRDINTIFSELGTLVASQAEAVENVSTAAAIASHVADSALAEIEKYNEKQKKVDCCVQ